MGASSGKAAFPREHSSRGAAADVAHAIGYRIDPVTRVHSGQVAHQFETGGLTACEVAAAMEAVGCSFNDSPRQPMRHEDDTETPDDKIDRLWSLFDALVERGLDGGDAEDIIRDVLASVVL